MNNSAPLQSISLYYREGSSDKVYHVQLLEDAGGYVVNFQYGRRGSTLQTGTKTSSPVARGVAEKTFSKLVAEKKAKGYTEGTSGIPYSSSQPTVEPSGYLPQLANSVDEATAASLLTDDRWCMQEKIDGVRQLIIRSNKNVSAANRKGLQVPVADTIAAAVLSLVPHGNTDFVLDGEAIGDVYVPFDILRWEHDLRMTVANTRLGLLSILLRDQIPDSLRKIRTAYTSTEKLALYEELKAKGAEGVIFKRLDAGYVPGRPASGGVVLKFKFCSMTTCIVIGVNAKRSVRLALGQLGGSGNVPVGNATIPPNHSVPKPGEIVEVQYLYAYPGGSLYQPVFLGVRTDKDLPDDISSLKLKPTSTDSDDE